MVHTTVYRPHLGVAGRDVEDGEPTRPAISLVDFEVVVGIWRSYLLLCRGN
jgi:hypothetical protein